VLGSLGDPSPIATLADPGLRSRCNVPRRAGSFGLRQASQAFNQSARKLVAAHRVDVYMDFLLIRVRPPRTPGAAYWLSSLEARSRWNWSLFPATPTLCAYRHFLSIGLI